MRSERVVRWSGSSDDVTERLKRSNTVSEMHTRKGEAEGCDGPAE